RRRCGERVPALAEPAAVRVLRGRLRAGGGAAPGPAPHRSDGPHRRGDAFRGPDVRGADRHRVTVGGRHATVGPGSLWHAGYVGLAGSVGHAVAVALTP